MQPDPLTLGAAAAGRRRRSRPPVAVAVAVVVLTVVVLGAVLGDVLAPLDPDAQDPLLGTLPPGDGHLLGTDELGRDLFSRLIAGTRNAVVGPLLVAIGTTLIGTWLGLLAGLRGGRTDVVISRVADLVYSIPALVVAIVVVGTISGSYGTTVAVLVVLIVPGFVRLVRSATLAQRSLPYVDAVRTLGVSNTRIMVRHLLPNVLPTVVACTLLDFVVATVSFASLAFLGLGVAPGSADWGNMLADGQAQIFDNVWAAAAPALAIIATVTSVMVLGDWLFDRLSAREAVR